MEKTFTAKTLDDAVKMAASELNIKEESLQYEILEQPKKGLFGTKGEAVIKVTVEENQNISSENSDGRSKGKIAADYVKAVIEKMGVTIVDMKVEEKEEGVNIEIVTEGDGDGLVIGRRGENLDALQYLASLVCNRGNSEYYRVTLDSCGYREKRKETLERLAARIAKNVLKTGRTSSLEPMNPYERRIIHSVVSEYEGLSSHSVGEEPYRKVVISSTTKKPGHTGDKRPVRRPKSDNLMTSFEKEYKRQSAPVISNDGETEAAGEDVPLYSKFEF